MSEPNVYAAASAAYITGVPVSDQSNWRRRGFLPASDGRHSRYTVRGLCQLRLIRAIVDAGFPISLAASELSEALLDSLQAEVIACAVPEYSSGMLAVLAQNGSSHVVQVVWSYHDIGLVVDSSGLDPETLHVIRLCKIAEDLVARGILDHPGLKDRT